MDQNSHGQTSRKTRFKVISTRVLANTEWELKFLLCWLNTLTRIGSDHCPLLLDTNGEVKGRGQKLGRQFFCECQWFKMDGFLGVIEEK